MSSELEMVDLTDELVETVLLVGPLREPEPTPTNGSQPAATDEQAMPLETWAQFERTATEKIPTLVDGLWPEAAFGFIAAPPKKGKTWLGLSLAISVAAGVPFLNRFDVPAQQPVIVLALEGHRAAIRGRIGVLARGMGLNPDSGDLANLHIAYKPPGLNLAEPAWVETVHQAARDTGAKLLIVDVLRAAAILKENDNPAFGAFLHQLRPITATGCSIALLHHFGKLTEISKERSPGERMSGAGAMYGAFDVGVFITGADDGARKLRVEFELRDLASPEPLGVHLTGTPTGVNGGFVYHDTATWEIEEAPDESDLTANATEVIEWLEQQPGRQASTSELLFGLGCSDNTLLRRRQGWIAAGVIWTPRKGNNPAMYSLPDDWENLRDAQHLMTPRVPPAPSRQTHVALQETLDMQEEPGTFVTPRHVPPNALGGTAESADLQEESITPRHASPTESNPHADAATAPDPDVHLDELAATVDLEQTAGTLDEPAA